MAKTNEIYKCNKCGIITEILHSGVGTLVCCEEPMVHLQENTVDAAKEKHVPVLQKCEDTVEVKVGSTPHPMQEDHYIEFIEVICGNIVQKQFLKPGDEPVAVFKSCHCGSEPIARAYCNIHGLWSNS